MTVPTKSLARRQAGGPSHLWDATAQRFANMEGEMELEQKFKWVVGHPPDGADGEKRMVLGKTISGSLYPVVAEFLSGRWAEMFTGEGLEIVAYAPFAITTSTSRPMKLETPK